ncbi:MAG: hypothetical protein ACJAVM_001180 [Sulfitobacter sp.]
MLHLAAVSVAATVFEFILPNEAKAGDPSQGRL